MLPCRQLGYTKRAKKKQMRETLEYKKTIPYVLTEHVLQPALDFFKLLALLIQRSAHLAVARV